MADRRRFLAAVGAAGAAGLAGCVGGFGGLGGGGDGPGAMSGDPTPDPDNDRIPPEWRDFTLPPGRATTQFDAELTDETTLVEGESMDAVVEADTEAHRYVIDESKLDGDLSEGSVLLVSGVALRRITSISRDGDRSTVETAFAPVTDAVENGTVGWDATVGFDAAFSPDAEGKESRIVPAAGSNGAAGSVAQFAGVGMVDGEGDVDPIPDRELQVSEGKLKWTYTDDDREYTFQLTVKSEDEVEVKVQVKHPVSGDADLAYTAKGTVGSMRSVAQAEIEDGELSTMEFDQNDVAADVEVSIAAAGSGKGSIDWEFPGLMFRYVVFAGPIPITIGVTTKLIGAITVPAKASATASSKYTYRGDAGFSYAGSDVDVDANVGTHQFDPEPADSASVPGADVDAQFGVAFPRIEVSVFDTLLVPYIHTGFTIGSRLTWGPLCKQGYVKMVVQAGYDLETFGVTLASDQTTLYEDQNVAKGDSCGD